MKYLVWDKFVKVEASTVVAYAYTLKKAVE